MFCIKINPPCRWYYQPGGFAVCLAKAVSPGISARRYLAVVIYIRCLVIAYLALLIRCMVISLQAAGRLLAADHGHSIDNIVNGAAAGKVVNRFSHALEHWADGDSIAKVLNSFITCITGLQVGEDEYIGMAGNRAARSFKFANAGNYCGIKLQLAIEQEFRITLMGNFYCAAYFICQLMLGAALGGEAKHGNARLLNTNNIDCRMVAAVSYLSQLF